MEKEKAGELDLEVETCKHAMIKDGGFISRSRRNLAVSKCADVNIFALDGDESDPGAPILTHADEATGIVFWRFRFLAFPDLSDILRFDR